MNVLQRKFSSLVEILTQMGSLPDVVYCQGAENKCSDLASGVHDAVIHQHDSNGTEMADETFSLIRYSEVRIPGVLSQT